MEDGVWHSLFTWVLKQHRHFQQSQGTHTFGRYNLWESKYFLQFGSFKVEIVGSFVFGMTSG
jgi:hypothetical protein